MGVFEGGIGDVSRGDAEGLGTHLGRILGAVDVKPDALLRRRQDAPYAPPSPLLAFRLGREA